MPVTRIPNRALKAVKRSYSWSRGRNGFQDNNHEDVVKEETAGFGQLSVYCVSIHNDGFPCLNCSCASSLSRIILHFHHLLKAFSTLLTMYLPLYMLALPGLLGPSLAVAQLNASSCATTNILPAVRISSCPGQATPGLVIPNALSSLGLNPTPGLPKPVGTSILPSAPGSSQSTGYATAGASNTAFSPLILNSICVIGLGMLYY